MTYLKNLTVDLLSLIGIFFLTYTQNEILRIILLIYAALLLISKVAVLFMPYLQKKASSKEAPQWIYHIIYALSVGLLFYSGYYYLGGIWTAIWLLSVIAVMKMNKSLVNNS